MRALLTGLVLLCVGAGIGVLLITWGGARYSQGPKAPIPALRPEPAAGAGTPPALAAERALPESLPAGHAPGPRVSGAQVITVVGTPPVAPTPPAGTATPPKFQPNGWPVGVVKNAYNPEVYKKLPGVQPPTINYDGRDMSAEALSMVRTRREPVPMPGVAALQQQPQSQSNPGGPPQARPFPKTVEEINAGLNTQATSPQ